MHRYNPLGPSQKAIQAIKNNIDNINRYPDGNATILREKIAEKHGLPPDNIICGAGSDELITLLMRSYADKDDEILYSEYGFLMYPITAISVGASPKIGLDENYKVNIKSILQNITAKTKIIFIRFTFVKKIAVNYQVFYFFFFSYIFLYN